MKQLSDIKKILGSRIRNLRNERGWSQEEFAHRANLSQSYFGALERGEKSASIETLEKISLAFGISFEELFRYIQPSSENAHNTTLSLLMDKLNSLSIDEQKTMLNLLDALFELMKRK